LTIGMTTGPDLKKVRQINNQVLEVQGDAEKLFYDTQKRKYLAENKFTNVADLTDLDRLLFLELLMFRWSNWLSKGQDYDGLLRPGAEEVIRKSIEKTAPLISQIKNDLGLTLSQRTKEQAESVGAYITELKKRAKEHGIRREQQLTRALCLIEELSSLVGTFDRSNKLERSKVGLETEADIVDWIRTSMLPDYREVDEHFRAASQKFWVGRI
jgi:hypothetical protein